MPPIALITSSAASLPAEILQRYPIHLVPFTVQFVSGNYKESGDLSLEDFYQRLVGDDIVPTTAPTSVAQFINYFQHQHPEAETLLVIHLNARTSKAYDNAVQAAARVSSRRIVNIDTGSFAMGTGLHVIEAAKALQDGADLPAVMALLERLSGRTLALFAPASVRYLRLSGRVGRVPALAASLLGVHPILGLSGEGEMEVVSRPRSAEAAQAALVERLQEFVAAGRVRGLAVSHTNNQAAAERLRSTLQAAYPKTPIYLNDAGPILAVHVGPGAVGLAAIRDD